MHMHRLPSHLMCAKDGDDLTRSVCRSWGNYSWCPQKCSEPKNGRNMLKRFLQGCVVNLDIIGREVAEVPIRSSYLKSMLAAPRSESMYLYHFTTLIQTWLQQTQRQCNIRPSSAKALTRKFCRQSCLKISKKSLQSVGCFSDISRA